MLENVDTAATSLIKDLQSDDHVINDSSSISGAVNQIALFKQYLRRVCSNIVKADIKVGKANGVDQGTLPCGVEEIPRPAVLTLTSQTNRQTDTGPKPLYSGLQRQNSAELQKLDPGSLPNGITVNHVPPSNALGQTSSAKQKRAFGEVFRPHRSLKALEPPRPSRNATRGSSLSWLNHEELTGSERPTPVYKSDHRYASLPTGSWLHYNIAEASAASAPDSKRRQRDRALSLGESRAAAEEIAKHEQARITALFQSAYSSFAPSIDNSAAVVPEASRSQAWWNIVGQKRFQALLALHFPEPDFDEQDSPLAPTDQTDDDFEAAVANFEGDVLENPLQDHGKDVDPKQVDEILQELSDLLYTLNSYQRIRNLSKKNSDPADPTSAETDVYNILRSNLAIIVESLPPYAVAKLSGDQLEMLNISTNVVVSMQDHAGTMEHDEYSMQRQRVVMPATHPATGRGSVSMGAAGRPGNYSAQAMNYNQRLNYSNAPRTPYSNQPRPTSAYGNNVTSQPQTYPAARATPLSSQRASLSAQQHYPNQTYSHVPSAAQFQNGYEPSYVQSLSSQAYTQPRQDQSSHSYPLNQSPQKSVQSPPPIVHIQQPYTKPQQLQQSQGSPSSIHNQAVITERARSQLVAQRQLTGTPQMSNINGRFPPMARSLTPVGGTPNGNPTVAAVSGGQ